jgi:ADP-ribosylglycohydrolase
MIKLSFENLEHKILVAALIGDVIGQPHEFKSKPKEIYVDNPNLLKEDKEGFKYATWESFIGYYSDDFSQTLAVYNSIQNSLDFIKEIFLWKNGKYWINNILYDIGSSTQKALQYYSWHEDIIVCDEYMNGNGSLMRISTIGLLDNYAEIYKNYTNITHNHEVSNDICLIYLNLVNSLKNGISFNDWLEINRDNKYLTQEVKLGTGYVVSSLQTAIESIKNSNSFMGAVKNSIMYGNDTDTNGLITATIASMLYDIEISEEWYEFIQFSLKSDYVKFLEYKVE